MAKTLNTRFSRGLVSSRKLHRPEMRQMNKMEKKALAILRKRRMEKEEQDYEAARQARIDAMKEQQKLVAVVEKKQSKVGRMVSRVKEVLRKKVF